MPPLRVKHRATIPIANWMAKKAQRPAIKPVALRVRRMTNPLASLVSPWRERWRQGCQCLHNPRGGPAGQTGSQCREARLPRMAPMIPKPKRWTEVPPSGMRIMLAARNKAPSSPQRITSSPANFHEPQATARPAPAAVQAITGILECHRVSAWAQSGSSMDVWLAS